ncbi:vitellogenin-3 [Anabrus simplex]|uniref:vitellogenin-3 n=1 Tax=Anabrus simplex TaxID=316456 RepID=UPI0035A3BB30
MAVFFIGLLVLSSVSADGIWPLGQELIYDYSADVRAAQVTPTHFGSRYTIYGKLRVQADGEDAVVKLGDVRHRLYNGELPESQQSASLPAPEDAAALTSVFRIQYKDGKVKKLFTETSDPHWVLNMKKGLASLLQIDLSQRLRMDTPSAFWGEEDSLFGTCDVAYSFIGDGHYNTVTKTVNPATCKDYPLKVFTNAEFHGCGHQHKENAISSLYKRVYRIKLGDAPVLTNISSELIVGYEPLRANSDLGYLKIEQKLHLEKTVSVEQKLVLNDQQEVQDLRYSHPEPDNLLGTGMDWSQGRVKVDGEALVTKAVSMLDDILEYQEEAHVDTVLPDFKRSALLDRYISIVLGRMGLEGLSSIYTQLSQAASDWDIAKRDLFVKLLPQVGTHAATITVRNLIRKHKVKTWTAQEMLQSLAFNVRHPSEKLLQEMEELINLNDEYPEQLRHVAILSFATLVYKTTKDNTNAEFRTRTVDKYAQLYFRRALDAKDDFATQLVYLQGLDNMRVGKAADVLEVLTLEGGDFNRHVQHLAAWYTFRNVLHNYNKAYRIFWPILIDPQRHLQLRASALTALMESASSMDHLMTIHSYMAKNINEIHLYKLYYKLLKAKTMTTNPCFGRSSEFATRLLRFTPYPKVDHWGTGMEMYDFTDNTYGFGKAIRLQILADHATGFPSVLYASLHDTSSGYIRNPFSVYLKMEGLGQVLSEITGRSDVEPTKAPAKLDVMGLLRRHEAVSADDIIRKVSDVQMKLDKPIHIELLVYKHDQAIYSLYLNNTVLDRALQNEIPLRLKEFKNIIQNMNLHRVDLPLSTEVHVPTDLGVPLTFSKHTPSILTITGNTKVENGFTLETIFRRSSLSVSRTAIFNPVAGAWHGVQRFTANDAQVPVRVGVERDDRGVKFVVGHPHGVEELNATIGSRWFTQSQTFVYEEGINNNLLGASCAACRRVVPVTRGARHLNDMVIAHAKIPGTGLIADVKVFACERQINLPSLKKLIRRFFDASQMNSHDDPKMQMLIGLNHMLMYNEQSPASGQCGFLTRVLPDPEIGQGSQVEFSMKMTGGEIPGGNIVLQGVKLRIVGLWVLKGNNGDAIRKTDIKLDITTTAGNEDNTVALQLANYRQNKPDSKWCWLLTKKYPARQQDALAFGWGNEQVDSKASITIGSFEVDEDGVCPSDSVSVTVNVKGEITDEQKQRAEGDDWPYGQCKEDKKKSEWQNSDFVPNTQACYIGSILLTTTRKLTYSVSHSKLPPHVEYIVSYIEELYRSALAPHYQLLPEGNLKEPGTAELVLKYSAYKPTVDMIVSTPRRRYAYVEVPTGASSADDYNPAFDNTHYSRFHLLIETTGISKPCFVNPENVYTPDNATVPHKQGSDYVLVAGLAGDPNRFSAFTKSQGGSKPMVLKLVNDGVTLELSRDGASINGKAISLEKGVQYPADDPYYAIRVWKLGDLVMAYSRRTAVFIYYTGGAVDVEQPVTHRGRATGLCGNLNGDPQDD